MFNPGQEISSLDFGAIIGGSLNAVVKAQSQSAQTTVDFIKRVGFQKKTEIDENGNKIESDVPINVAFSYDREVSPAQVIGSNAYTVIVDEESKGAGYEDEEKTHYSLKAGENELPIEKLKFNNKAVESITLGNMEGIEVSDGAELKLVYTFEGDEENPAKAPTKDAVLKLQVKTTYESVPAVMQKMSIQVPILTMLPIPFIKIESADIDFNVKINSVSTTSSEDKSETKVNSSVHSGWFVKADLSASFSNQKSSNSSEEVKKDYSLNIKVHAAQDDMPAGVSRILDMLEETIKVQPAGAPKVVEA